MSERRDYIKEGAPDPQLPPFGGPDYVPGKTGEIPADAPAEEPTPPSEPPSLSLGGEPTSE